MACGAAAPSLGAAAVTKPSLAVLSARLVVAVTQMRTGPWRAPREVGEVTVGGPGSPSDPGALLESLFLPLWAPVSESVYISHRRHLIAVWMEL